jgi:hypothetical protein
MSDVRDSIEAAQAVRTAEEFFAEETRPDTSEPFCIGPVTYDALLRCVQIAKAATGYVDIRTFHPQVSGEAWRELCESIDGGGER